MANFQPSPVFVAVSMVGHGILGDYTRLDEAIMVLRGAEAERKAAMNPTKGPLLRRGLSLNHDRRSQDVYSCFILYLELP